MLKGICTLRAKQNAKNSCVSSQNIGTKLTNPLVAKETTGAEMLFTPIFVYLSETISKQTTCKK
jgi:hypothetical protein